MNPNHRMACAKTSWRGRRAYALENGRIRLVILTGGGHIAEFTRIEGSGKASLNPLWKPPWETIEPDRYKASVHEKRYGPPAVGKMLSGVAGHNLCLDYFGEPSEDEAAQGLSIHGEAPSAKWAVVGRRVTAREARLNLSVGLPVAGLRFLREIRLLCHECVAYIRETVINERRADQLFHWVEHVTLGPPFLSQAESRIAISATRGRTWAHGYEGKDLLRPSCNFRWPDAPGASGKVVDLTRPFTHAGTGFLTTLLLDRSRDMEFVSALNVPSRLLIAYCFRRSDFPWVAIWEENRARTGPPWKGRTQARGLEFGSTPFPVGRREAFANGPLFDTPVFSVVPARGGKTVQYIALLVGVPEGLGSVRDIRLAESEVQIFGEGRTNMVSLEAAGLA